MLTSSDLAGKLIETVEILLIALRDDHRRWPQIGKAVEVLSALQVHQAEGHISEIGEIVKGNTDDGGQKPIHPGH